MADKGSSFITPEQQDLINRAGKQAGGWVEPTYTPPDTSTPEKFQQAYSKIYTDSTPVFKNQDDLSSYNLRNVDVNLNPETMKLDIVVPNSLVESSAIKDFASRYDKMFAGKDASEIFNSIYEPTDDGSGQYKMRQDFADDFAGALGTASQNRDIRSILNAQWAAGNDSFTEDDARNYYRLYSLTLDKDGNPTKGNLSEMLEKSVPYYDIKTGKIGEKSFKDVTTDEMLDLMPNFTGGDRFRGKNLVDMSQRERSDFYEIISRYSSDVIRGPEEGATPVAEDPKRLALLSGYMNIMDSNDYNRLTETQKWQMRSNAMVDAFRTNIVQGVAFLPNVLASAVYATAGGGQNGDEGWVKNFGSNMGKITNDLNKLVGAGTLPAYDYETQLYRGYVNEDGSAQIGGGSSMIGTMLALAAQIATPAALGSYAGATRALAASNLGGVGTGGRALPGVSTLLKQGTTASLLRDARIAETVGAVIDGGVTAALNTTGKVANMAMSMLDKAVGTAANVGVDATINPIARSAIYGAITNTVDNTPNVLRGIGLSDAGTQAATGKSFAELISAPAQTGRTPILGANDIGRVSQAWGGVQDGLRSFVSTISRLSPDLLTEYGERLSRQSLATAVGNVAKQKAAGEITGEAAEASIRSAQRWSKAQQLFYRTLNDIFKNMPVAAAMSYAGALGNVNAMVQNGMIGEDENDKAVIDETIKSLLLSAAMFVLPGASKTMMSSLDALTNGGVGRMSDALGRNMRRVVLAQDYMKRNLPIVRSIVKHFDKNKAGSAGEIRTEIVRQYVKGKGKIITKEQFDRFRNMTSGAHGDYILAKIMRDTGFDEVFKAGDALNKTLDVGVTRMAKNKGTQVQKLVGDVINKTEQMYRNEGSLKQATGKRARALEENIGKLKTDISNARSQLNKMGDVDEITKGINRVTKALQNGYAARADILKNAEISYGDQLEVLRSSPEFEHGYIRLMLDHQESDDEIIKHISSFFMHSGKNADPKKVLQTVKNETTNLDNSMNPFSTFMTSMQDTADLLVRNDTNKMVTDLVRNSIKTGSPIGKVLVDGDDMARAGQRVIQYKDFKKTFQAQVDEQIDVLVSSTGEAADPDAFVSDLYSYTLNDNYIKNLARKAGVSTELMARSSVWEERESILSGVYNRYVKEKGQKFAMSERAKVSKAIEETATNRAGIRQQAEARAAEKTARQTQIREMTNEQIAKISNDANASKMDKLIAHDEMVNRRIAPDDMPEIVQPKLGESLARFDKQLPEVQNLAYKYVGDDILNKVEQIGPDYEVSVGSMNFVSRREMRGILSSDIPTAKQAAAARAHGENPGMSREDLGIADLPSYYFSKQGTLPDQFTTASDTDPQGWVYMAPEEAMGQIRSATSALADNAAIRDEVSKALNNTDLIAMARDEYVYNIGNTPNMVLKNDVVAVAKNTGFSQDNAARAMNKLPAEAVDLLKGDNPVSPTVLASTMNFLGLSGKFEATISHFSDALNVPWSKADQNSPLADIAVVRTNVEKALYDAGDMTTLHAYRKKIVDETNALAKSFGESIDDRIIKRQIQSSSNDKTALDMIGFYKEKLLSLRTREYVQQTTDVFYQRRNLSAPERIVAVRSGEYEIQDFNPLVNSRGYMHTYDAIADVSLGDATNNPSVAFGDGLMVDVRDKALMGRLANRIEKDFGGIPELSATRKDFVDKARGSIEEGGAPFAYDSITKPAVIEAMKGYGIVGMRMSSGKTADDIILWDAKPKTKGGDWFDKMDDVNTMTDQEIAEIKTNNKLASEIYRSDYAKAEEELSANERRVYGAKQAGEVVITYVQDGKKYVTQIDSPGLAAVYANTPARQMTDFSKGLAKFSNALRLGTTGTLNVPYAAVNYIRDFMEAAIATPGALFTTKYSKDLFISMTAMSDMTTLSDTELVKIFEELSTAYSTYNKNVTDAIYADAPKDRTRITMSEMAKHTEDTGRRIRYRMGTLGGQKENLEFAMNKVETGRRNAVAETTFMQAYQDQMAGVLAGNITKEQAVSNAMERAIAYARDATTDFSMRSGNFNALYASVPYLRAVVNGAKSFGNVFAMDPIGMTARMFAYAVAPMIAITAANTSDPYKAAYYENIPEYERQGNLILMNDDGTFYEIPLPQPLQGILGGFRTWVERKNNVYANSGVVESMLQGMAMLSPVDYSGFFQRDIEGDINQSLGWLRMINSVMPNAVTPVLEGLMDTNLFTGNPLNPSIEDLISMGVKPEIVDGKLQIDPSKYTYSKSNSKLLGMLANMTGIPQGEIQNGIGRYMGTFGKYAINGIDRLIGAPTEEQGGQDVLTNTANRFFGADPQAAESAFSAGMSRFYDLKDQIINAVDYKTSDDEKNDLIKQYTQDLVAFTDAYNSYYRNSGGMTDLKREKLINLLNFSKNVSTTGDAYSESNEAQSLREKAAATKRAVDAGLVSNTGLRQYQQGKAKVDKDGNVITDENGNPVIQYVSPAMTAVQNRVYGAPTEAANQFKASLDTALPSGVTLDQAYDNAWKNIGAVYDRADKAGRKLQQADYDEIASYKEDFMQDFDSKLVPLLERYSTSILSNPEFRGAIEQYAKLAIPDEVWKKGTNGRFLSTTKYPNVTVDIKDALRQRYANLLPVGKATPDSGRITESVLQSMRGGL